MKSLAQLRDDLDTARLFVECAFAACHHIEDSDPIAAVLHEASDKLAAANRLLSVVQRDVSKGDPS